jgi:hypothetical protein
MASALILNTVQCSRLVKSCYALRNVLMAWVPEVASVTIRICRLAHFLMVLYNVPVLLKLIVFCIVCSTTVQIVFCKLSSTAARMVFSLQYYATNCIHSAVLHYKLYSLSSTTLQTAFTLQYYTTYCIHFAVLHYKLHSLCSTTLQTVLCKLCSTTVQMVFTAVLFYKLHSLCSTTLQTVFCKLCSTTVQTVFCKPSVVLHCRLLYSVKLGALHYKLFCIHSAELHYKLFFIPLVYITNSFASRIVHIMKKMVCAPHRILLG